tara:strand:+ start:72 stop:302 length:231 start_codon:yes stop_codon:yes gene_type:complete
MSEEQQEFEFVHQETEINERPSPEKIEMIKKVEGMMQTTLPKVEQMLAMKEETRQMISEVKNLLQEVEEITKRLSD